MKRTARKLGRVIAVILLGVVGLFAVEVGLALNGPEDHFQNPSRDARRFGGPGKPLVYVVMGDSTAAGEGAPYDDGIALETARYLSRSGPVTMTNLAVAGATVDDVVKVQLSQAVTLKPDVVLLAVGANDATHFTSNSKVSAGMTAILDGLQGVRPGIRVVLTGSPQLGSAPRFTQPLRWFAGTQTGRVNQVITEVGVSRHALLAPIAKETGPIFAADRTLYAPDRFHPSARGYATWFPILNHALDGRGADASTL